MMNYAGFTNEGLLMLQSAVHKAIGADKEAIKSGDSPPCKTSETPDWAAHARGIEDELVRRNVSFIPVRFLDR